MGLLAKALAIKGKKPQEKKPEQKRPEPPKPEPPKPEPHKPAAAPKRVEKKVPPKPTMKAPPPASMKDVHKLPKKTMPGKMDLGAVKKEVAAVDGLRDKLWDKDIVDLKNYADMLDVPYTKSKAKSAVIEAMLSSKSADEIVDVMEGRVKYDRPAPGPVTSGHLLGEFLEDQYNIYDVKKVAITEDGDVEMELWVYPYGEGFPMATLPAKFTYPQFKLLEAGREVKSFSTFDPYTASEEEVDGELLEMLRAEADMRGKKAVTAEKKAVAPVLERKAVKEPLKKDSVKELAEKMLAGEIDPADIKDDKLLDKVFKYVQKIEVTEEDVVEEEVEEPAVHEVVVPGISFSYTDILQTEGPFKGYPAYPLFKRELAKMGIKLEKGDPLWDALKKQKGIPSEMIMERLSGKKPVVVPAEVPVKEDRKKVIPPSREAVEEEEHRAMSGILKDLTLDELQIVLEDPRRDEWPIWKEGAVKDEMSHRAESYADKIISGDITEEDLPYTIKDDVISAMEDKLDDIKESMGMDTPIPKVVSAEVKEAYGYEDILDEAGRPNYFKFTSVLKKLDFDTSDENRNRRWFTTTQITKRVPSKGEEVFKETWQEFQKRVAEAYVEFMPKDDKERREFVSHLWKTYGQKGKPIPPDIWAKASGMEEPVMSHAEWMSLYLSAPYKMGFKKANELWNQYGKYGNMPPNEKLPVDADVQKWVTKETSPTDAQAVLKWIDDNKIPIRREQVFDMFRDSEKTDQIMKDMEVVTWEGQKRRFKKYFDHLAQYAEGREKLKFLALESGYDFQNPSALKYIVSEHFGDEGPTAFIQMQHFDTGILQDAFLDTLADLPWKPSESEEFQSIWKAGSVARDFKMKDDLEEIEVTTEDINEVTDKGIEMYQDYVRSVGGRDVDAHEFFAANPEVSRKDAKAIYEKAAMLKSAAEYGETGRKPLPNSKIESILNGIMEYTKNYKVGQNKNVLAKKIHDFNLFNREWRRRTGKNYEDIITVGPIGAVSTGVAERYANNEFTREMLPDEHVEMVHAWMKENLRVPTRETLLEIIPDASEADYILKNVVYTDVENILAGDRPYEFSEEEVRRMATRKGLSGVALRSAMKAWHDKRQLPMTALELSQKDFEKRQLELAEKFGAVSSSEGARSHLREIIKLSPNRSAAARKIGEYIEDLENLIKKKRSDRVRIISSWVEEDGKKKVEHTGLAELEAKKKKSADVKKKIAEMKAQVDEIDKEILQIGADIDQATSDMKYRVYKELPEDYLKGQARFGPASDEDKQFSNFSNRRIEVARSVGTFAQGGDAVYVNLADIFDHWVAPIESGLDNIIRRKAKESKDPMFKDTYEAYVDTEEREQDLVEKIAEVESEIRKEDLSEDKLVYLSEQLETYSSVLNRMDRDQRARLERMASYTEREQVEPTVEEIIKQRELKGVWPEDWQKKIATVAFMNKARELGVYDYMYEMAQIGHDMTPPMKDIPLTVYPSDSSTIREALFGEWLKEALTQEDIAAWDPKTMIQFVGEDWDLCEDIFGRLDTAKWADPKEREKKATDRKDKWRECAVRKAKVIQSQAISQADPLVLQPIIEEIVREVPLEKTMALEKEKAYWQSKLKEAASLSEELGKKMVEIESDKTACEKQIKDLRKQLSDKGVVTAEVKKGRRKRVEAVTPVDTEDKRALVRKIEALEDKIIAFAESIDDVVEEACEGDVTCVETAMDKIEKVEKDIMKGISRGSPRVIEPVEGRDFCFTTPEWETFVVSIAERKKNNATQLKKAKKMLDDALDQGISRSMPVYQTMVGSLEREKAALGNLEDFIRKYDQEAFICSKNEMKTIRKMSGKDIEEALEI